MHSLSVTALAVAVLVLAGCGELDEEDSGVADEDPRPAALYLAGDGEMWVVDPDAEQAERIKMPALSAGDPPHRVEAIGDQLALWGYDVFTVPVNDPSARPRTIAKDGWIFIPATDPDRIWVGFLSEEGSNRQRRLRELKEIDSDGDVITSGVEAPGGAWPFAEATSGLIFTGEAGIELWDPDSGRLVRTFSWRQIGDIGPVSGDIAAGCPDDECEELILTDLGTAQQQRFPAPEGLQFAVFEGSFSPDGETLAVPVFPSRGGWRSYSTQGRQLALVSLANGQTEIIAGPETPPGYTFTEWSPDGTQVFTTGGERFQSRTLVSYRLGDERAERIDAQVGDFYDMAVAASP